MVIITSEKSIISKINSESTKTPDQPRGSDTNRKSINRKVGQLGKTFVATNHNMKKPSRKQPTVVSKKLQRSNHLSNNKKVLASNKKAFKKSNKSVIKEIKKDKVKTENNEKDTVKTENNENTTLLPNSKKVSNGKQDIECDKNSDQVKEKPISASKKRKRSDPGHAKASLDNRSQINRKLEPEYRLDIKKQWEIARRKNITPDERNKSISRLFEMVRGNVPGLLFKNDTSRVIETCLKYGTKEQRNIIASELEGHLLEASKNNPEYRSKILTEFKGQVKKLFIHTEARNVLLEAYELSNVKQRSSLLEEFYDLIAEDPSNKDKVLKNLFQAIQYLIKKPESLNYIIMHRILLEYFTYADDSKIREVIEVIGEHDRKTMLKSMKEYAAKICKEEYGYLVLLRAFDVVDDTVSQIVKPGVLKTIMQDKFGHRVILYLLTGRAKSKMYLSFETFQLLEKDDEIREKTSKKDSTARSNELRKAISPALINYSRKNIAEMLSNTYMTQIFCETLLCGDADIEEKRSILENIPPLIGETSNENNIMLTYANRFLKVLVQGQYQRLDNGQSEDKRVELHFAPLLFDSIKKDIIFYACNASASFVILALLQDKETRSEVRKILIKNRAEIEQAALKDVKSGSRFILKELGCDVTSLIKTLDDESNAKT
ncbi:18284_t:CDS:2, partial [Racocetra fulgida]